MKNQGVTGENPPKKPPPPGPDPKGLASVRAVMDAAEPWETPPDDIDEFLSRLETNDSDNAVRFMRRFGRDFVYLVNPSGWHYWDGRRWAFDPEALKTREKMAETAAAIASEVRHIEEKDRATKRASWAIRSRDARRIMAAVEMLQVFRNEDGKLYDTHPLLFNCENGTVHLDTGQLRPARQEDRITLASPVPHHPKATCPIWLRFLETIFGQAWDGPRDPLDDCLEGIQRLLGYTLSGLTTEQIMVALHGTGSNGKSVLLEVVGHIMGEYSAALAVEALMSQSTQSSHQSDIARLKGKRFVTTVEADEGKALNESLLKKITGGDTMTAREIWKGVSEFTPQCTIYMATNHLPRIRGGDFGIWRRIILIPFTQKFVDPEDAMPGDLVKDRDLKAKLLAEAPGILAWIIHGFRLYARDGLRTPRRWLEAAGEYRAREDVFGEFLKECVITSPSEKVGVSTLLKCFNSWAKQDGCEVMNNTSIGNALSSRGLASRKIGGVKFVRGLALTDEGHRFLTCDQPGWGD